MGQQETMVTRKNRIMIFGPKTDGIYVVEFRTAAGEALAIPRLRSASYRAFNWERPYLSARHATERPL
jgi:hypothetical protein